MIGPLGIHRFPPFHLVLHLIITRTSETKTFLRTFNKNVISHYLFVHKFTIQTKLCSIMNKLLETDIVKYYTKVIKSNVINITIKQKGDFTHESSSHRLYTCRNSSS